MMFMDKYDREAKEIMEEWSGSEQDLIKIASKQKKSMSSFSDVYHYATKQIAKECVKCWKKAMGKNTLGISEIMFLFHHA
jgi:hypothetical protein